MTGEQRVMLLARLLTDRGYAPDDRAATAQAIEIMTAAQGFTEARNRPPSARPA